jgi:dipeptidyl aminopeptidase/acylaminoacyl peptidase
LFTSSRPSLGDPEGDKKKPQLFMIPADGGEARQITNVDEAVQSPAWSPDGRSILFLSKVFKGENVEGSDVKIIRRMKYKHDGKGFSVGMYPHLFVVPAKGGKGKQVTDGLFDVEAAVWSPYSKRIAFIANLGEDADKSFHRNIYTVSPKGGEPELLWEGKGPIGTLEWSPDGQYIAFSGRELENPSLVWHKNTEVYILDLEEGGTRCLTGDFDRTAGRSPNLKWSPDSGKLYALFPHHGTTHIHRIGLLEGVEKVTEGEIDIGSFTLDGPGTRIAFNASDAMAPAELFILDDEQRRLTEMNKGLLKKLRVSPPEEFWFTASDGVEVQGWIVKPRN